MITSFCDKYRFLSNFWYCKVMMDGEEYPSTEHGYQAAKSLNKEYRKKQQQLKTPAESKKLGNTKRLKKDGLLREDWDEVKLTVMEDLLRQKFNKSEFAELLLDTGDEELIEGNYWHDCFWGQCPLGNGENHLGKLLMKIRKELQENGYKSGENLPGLV